MKILQTNEIRKKPHIHCNLNLDKLMKINLTNLNFTKPSLLSLIFFGMMVDVVRMLPVPKIPKIIAIIWTCHVASDL